MMTSRTWEEMFERRRVSMKSDLAGCCRFGFVAMAKVQDQQKELMHDVPTYPAP